MDVHIDAILVARLMGEQFPHWASLPVVAVAQQGWDNRSFRVGERLVARLPSSARYAPQVDREQNWLPKVTPGLRVAAPDLVAKGSPSPAYPWPWSIYRWIEGEPATRAQLVDMGAFAVDVATFLSEMHAIDSRDGPRPSSHNCFRGGSLAVYDQQARAAIARVGDDPLRDAVRALWAEAIASEWSRPPVWVHGDLAASNLLVRRGRLCGVIDFGCLAIGDPACDLSFAWTFLDQDSRANFRRIVGLDDATWTRARAWALWKAAILATGLVDGQTRDRHTAGRVLRSLLVSGA